MLELLDPKYIDPYAYDKGYLESIKKYSLLPNRRIGWNYCMDYSWVAMKCEKILSPGMKIVDVGCGPGAIHGYLESKHQVEIIGIDRKRWERDYVDIVGDFTNDILRDEHGLNDLDLVISISAIEHNNKKDQKDLLESIKDSLKPNGIMIITSAVSWIRSTYFSQSQQWNLNKYDTERLYNIKFKKFNYISTWWRWHTHREIPSAFKNRYGRWLYFDPPFVSIGVVIKK